jgi:hypothetical protein
MTNRVVFGLWKGQNLAGNGIRPVDEKAGTIIREGIRVMSVRLPKGRQPKLRSWLVG